MQPDKATTARLQIVATAAAKATNAEGAAVVMVINGITTVICRSGIPENFVPNYALSVAASEKAVFFATPHSTNADVVKALHDAGLSVFASSYFNGKSIDGYLCVFDREVRWLSAAQKFVLQTFATSIAYQLDLVALQSRDQDSTERLRLLESVVVTANDAVLITEAEPIALPGPRILYANPAFTRTTGYSMEEVLGKTPRILQGPETSAASREQLRAALSTWTPIEVELVNYKKDGTPFWVELSIVPVADDNGWWTHWVSVQRDVTERKALEEEAVRGRIAEAERAALVHRAFHDDLTGMRNRAYFMDRLRSIMNNPENTERLAVLFMDLDRFKIINDSLGHDVGDQLLIEIGLRLQRCVRSPDVVARIGGDEFTFLIRDTRDLRDSSALADRILKKLTEPIRLGNHEIVPGASIGICSVTSNESTPEDVMRSADIAMYHAKAQGGQRVSIFDPTMHERAIATMQTELELRAALALNEFELYYQPLVALSDGRVYGVEALVRWKHKTRGLVSPIEFIGIAEDTGLIVPLGSWILNETCRQLLEWEAAGLNELTMNVNVSGKQLFDKTFRDELEHACRMLGEHVVQLQIEITESVLLGRASIADDLLQWVRSLGVRVAFDDFGTGYSSLSYLQLYKIDTLKIDASFIWKMAAHPGNVEIVRAIISLGRAFGIAVVAEGVENEEQRELLLECGAQSGQGYLFSKPVRAQDIAALVQRATAMGGRALS